MFSILDLAKAAGVGEATIIRFSKKLGFSGFSELKKLFKDRLSASFTISSRFYNCVLQDNENIEFIYDFIELQKGCIDATRTMIASKQFVVACSLINSSNATYIFEDGGASRSPGDTLEFWLGRFGINVQRIDQSGHRLFDKIIQHKENDCLLAFCFGKDNNDLLKLLNYCKKESISTIVITDYINGAVAAGSDYVLELKRGPLQLFHSMSVSVLVAEEICLFLANLRKDTAYEKLRELDDIRKEYGI